MTNNLMKQQEELRILEKEDKIIDNNNINENNVANLTLFFPDIESEFNESKILSKSKNCVFLNRKINGEVHGIINDKKILIKS